MTVSGSKTAAVGSKGRLRPTVGLSAATVERAGLALLPVPALLTVGFLLVLPIISLVTSSFSDPDTGTITLGHYAQVFGLGGGRWRSYEVLGISIDAPPLLFLILKSIGLSFIISILVLVIAFAAAQYLAFKAGPMKYWLLMIITIPFWISYLLRIFAWRAFLGQNGVMNSALISAGITEEPIAALLYSPLAIVLTLVHAWVAFAVIPILLSLEQIPPEVLAASEDLGDTKLDRLLHVTLPIARPGLLAAFVLVFIPTTGDYVTPLLVGGPDGNMVGGAIAALFTKTLQPELGAALAISTMAVVALSVLIVFTLWRPPSRRWR